MLDWLNGELARHYTPVRVLKSFTSPIGRGKTRIRVLRHNTLHTDVIAREFTGSGEIYQALQTISHPNIPTIYETAQDGSHVVVLEEFIDGTTIAEVLQTRLYSEAETAKVISELCGALAALHSLGIIHRDIKPENVMIDRKGVVKLIDYGAAKFYKAYQVNDTVIIGTTGFAAPEQFGIAQSDNRTDIFSLGILLNVMLTGEHPSRHLYQGKRLARVIQKCTQIAPDKRYPNVQRLGKELGRWR